MAQIVKFPVKMKLQPETEERMQKIANDYINAMSDVWDDVCDGLDEKECEEMTGLLFTAMVECLFDAVGKM